MNHGLPNKTKRIALTISGATDALIGALLLLIGFGLLPIDISQYGFEKWHAILLGGIFFGLGVGFIVYNLSRWDE